MERCTVAVEYVSWYRMRQVDSSRTAARRGITDRGFSLVELLCVLGLVALLAAGASGFGRFRVESVASDASAHHLCEVLDEGRWRSLARGVVTRVIFTDTEEATGERMWLVERDDLGGWMAVGGVRGLPTGVVVRRAVGNGAGAGGAAHVSTFSGRAGFSVKGLAPRADGPWRYVEFRPSGMALPCLIVIGAATSLESEKLPGATVLRGLRISAYARSPSCRERSVSRCTEQKPDERDLRWSKPCSPPRWLCRRSACWEPLHRSPRWRVQLLSGKVRRGRRRTFGRRGVRGGHRMLEGSR